MRGATACGHTEEVNLFGFQSTLPMRGATPYSPFSLRHSPISIHAPHAGSDGLSWLGRLLHIHFNPRSPCGERLLAQFNWHTIRNFNPRSPCGERRRRVERIVYTYRFQSTLPMRGATIGKMLDNQLVLISIHAPHAGSDNNGDFMYQWASNFNPRSPCGERLPTGILMCLLMYFNPRSPCGERLDPAVTEAPPVQFQSTLPMRGATGVRPMEMIR